MRIKILGKQWTLRFGALRDCRGDCSAPGLPKVIRVDSRLNDEETAEVLIHEMLHAAGWHIDETFVAQFAEDAARVLMKNGYRRTEQANG